MIQAVIQGNLVHFGDSRELPTEQNFLTTMLQLCNYWFFGATVLRPDMLVFSSLNRLPQSVRQKSVLGVYTLK